MRRSQPMKSIGAASPGGEAGAPGGPRDSVGPLGTLHQALSRAFGRLGLPGWVRWCVGAGLFAVGVGTVAHTATTGGDFRLSIWYPGQALFHGRDPYDIASFERFYGVHQVEAFSKGWFPLYGPVHLWLGVVLGVLPVTVASAVWFALNVMGIVVLGRVAARALDPRLGVPGVLAVAGVVMLSRPGRGTLETGQVTVLYTLVTYVAWSQARKRPGVAAVALACALGKPPFGLPLLALLLACRMWRVALRGVAYFVAASLPIVVWLSVNAGSPASLWHAMVNNLSYSDHNPLDAPGSAGRIDALSLIARGLHAHVGGAPEVGAFVVLVGLVSVLVGWTWRRSGWPVTPGVLLLLGTVTVLCVAHEYYDLLLLTWPFAAAWGRPRASDPGRARGGLAVAALATPALVLSIVPAADTLKVLGLGTSTGGVSTATTACLLLALVGSAVVLARQRTPDDVDLGSGPAGQGVSAIAPAEVRAYRPSP